LLNATSVDGVYSADPKKDPNAVRFEKISAKELIKIISEEGALAGSNIVVDLLAVKIIERSKIRAIVFLGEPKNIKRAFVGDIGGIGTVIEP
jgi:uridylate kinase